MHRRLRTYPPNQSSDDGGSQRRYRIEDPNEGRLDVALIVLTLQRKARILLAKPAAKLFAVLKVRILCPRFSRTVVIDKLHRVFGDLA